MPNNQIYHKNYTEFGDPYQLVLPLNLEGLVPDDDSVRLLSHELEDLDYSLLYQAYSAKGRNPAVDPKTMFKILTYAYSQNIYSSRKIETACRRDINFMWLLAGQKAPDHSTIARFRTGFLADACENLFYQMVCRLEAEENYQKKPYSSMGQNWKPVPTNIPSSGRNRWGNGRQRCTNRFRKQSAF